MLEELLLLLVTRKLKVRIMGGKCRCLVSVFIVIGFRCAFGSIPLVCVTFVSSNMR